MSMMELLGGGAPPPAGAPAPPGGDLPPSMPDPQPHLAPGADPASGPADPAGGPGGPDPAAPPPDEADPARHASNEIDSLHMLISAARDHMDIPTVEPSEKHEMSKALMIFTKLLAGNQSMADSLSGANPALRKALGSSGVSP